MGFREFIPFAIESSKAAGIGVLPDDLTETVTANSPGPTPVQEANTLNYPHFVLQGRVNIDLECRADICMTKHLAQALDIDSTLHASGGIGVPQHMEISIWNTRRL